MMAASFPHDNYTPHGYLNNPHDAGPWSGLEAGGVIRSLEACGFTWFQPEDTMTTAGGLRVGLEIGGDRLLTPEDFTTADVRLTSRYHSSRAQSFDFAHAGTEVSFTFLLSGRDALLCRATLRSDGVPCNVIAQGVVQRPARRNARAVYRADDDALALLIEHGPWYALTATQLSIEQRIWDGERLVSDPVHVIGEAYAYDAGTLTGELSFAASAGEQAEIWIALGRGATPDKAVENAKRALAAGPETLRNRQAEDESFWRRAPRPVGDWPDSWRRGWVYDLETTRLMVRPPAGVFKAAWPTWCLFRPRVVLAENALDMLRLGYVDPEAAQAALLSAFEHAPQANGPCLFANGSLNMVAGGGDACGTSPAWCLPFHNIYQLYLWRPDRAWLQALYPHLEAYLEWWLEQRRDDEGWFVYRCTWEAGEDATARLDPERTGHGDIFHKVRPVELQAAMAHSALLLTRLARELGLSRERWGKWEALYQAYVERTRSMWNAAAQRFRDLYPTDVPPVEQRGSYWDAPADISALQLIPLLHGVAAPGQAHALAARLLEDFNKPPWTYWASWTYTLVEEARAVGAYEAAGRIAYDVLHKVYPRMDRRERANVGARPGTACEWWPDDLSQSNVLNETYGWGATTATLLLRHVFGFGPAENTDRVVFELAPALHNELLTTGNRLGFANLHYRAAVFDLELEVQAEERLLARLTSDAPGTILVEGSEGALPVQTHGSAVEFEIHNCHRYLVTIF